MDTIAEIDQALFLWLNGQHTPWLDPVMSLVSGKWPWAPLYALLCWLFVRRYRWHAVPLLLCVGLAIALADQITSGFMKPFFERLRPSRDPALEGLVHVVNGYRGGKYGFASSHAANAFALAAAAYWWLRPTDQWVWALWPWAVIVAYSRVYLGVHYPGDIMVGAAIGAMAGWGVAKWVFPWASRHFGRLANKPR